MPRSRPLPLPKMLAMLRQQGVAEAEFEGGHVKRVRFTGGYVAAAQSAPAGEKAPRRAEARDAEDLAIDPPGFNPDELDDSQDAGRTAS